ncbi:hypothetical protein B5M09_008930 [Aphanomyces astaci]|uniref:Uncharacterized protein n=1 Tax=Aphanomyces astaci TaxID=112090 RepID=A0A425D0G9_APHAT|nr:hypothetical protein B5M09_008930 [Aphanomyces astaci]
MDPSIDTCFAFVKTARHRTVIREERLDILRLHAWFRSQYTKAASKQVADALGRNLNLVQDVWQEYQASQTVTAATPGNRTTHITKVPRTKLVTQIAQQFVRDRRATRTRTTAVEVMMYLKEMCVLDIDVDAKKQFAASYRAVQRFLKAQGYKRGRRMGSSTYHMSKANALARDTYVKLMHPHSTAATRPNVVYTDESYIYHHYKSHHQDLYDPSDETDVQSKEKHKGRRYFFAIVKGEVGRQYTDMTKFADVKVRLEAAFANLKPNSIKGCVRVAQEKLKKLHEHLVQIDTLVSDEESSDDSDNSSDDGGDSE